MSSSTPLVGILMGSDSDWPKIKGVAAALEEFGVPFEARVMSAHRTPELVQEYVAAASNRGIKVLIAAAGGAVPLALAVRVLLHQMTRDLLFNILNHAKASKATVRVRHSDDSVCVVVEDDGVGFVRPPEKHWGKWKGLGLFSIRERLHAFGGTIRILSSRGKGTSVILVAPRRTDAPPETAAKGEWKK